jgi:uncharacterized membrane protein
MLASFMPDPLHAALVHMPVAFAVLAPLAAAGALLLVSRDSTLSGVAPPKGESARDR